MEAFTVRGDGRPDGIVGGGEAMPPPDGLGLIEALREVFAPSERRDRELASLGREVGRILLDQSRVGPQPRDWRFADSAWRENPVFRRMAQMYLAWSESMERLVDGADVDAAVKARAQFAAQVLTTAAAPTNFLLTNPAALKRAFETGGASLVKGVRNMVRDVNENGGMPTQVDRSAFKLGVNLAPTRGAVIHQEEVFQLIQYTPVTPKVRARPIVIVPPQINKYYFLDLAPGRSLVEHLVKQGFQVFMMSWHNPSADDRDRNLESYVSAVISAVAVALDITGSDAVHLYGSCAGGITAMTTLAHLMAKGDAPVHSATVSTTLIDWRSPTTLNAMSDADAVERSTKASSETGVVDGRAMGHLFSLLRPNELVWNYWVNNNLMGQTPPAFDVLAWNVDHTRLSAGLHADFSMMAIDEPFTNPGRLEVLGTPIDLANITCPVYVVAGTTDHITPWKSCYTTTQLLGGPVQFVLSNSGHIQAVVNPPGNPKSRYSLGPRPGPDPDAWLAASTMVQGTWWEHWVDWLRERAGAERNSPKAQGNRRQTVIEPAPGTYVAAT